MAAISYFDAMRHGQINGSSFAEFDGTLHDVELLAGNGRMILRVQLQGAEKPVDLAFTDEQAAAFASAVDAVVKRLGLD